MSRNDKKKEIIQEKNLSFQKAKGHSLFMLILTLKPKLQ